MLGGGRGEVEEGINGDKWWREKSFNKFCKNTNKINSSIFNKKGEAQHAGLSREMALSGTRMSNHYVVPLTLIHCYT